MNGEIIISYRLVKRSGKSGSYRKQTGYENEPRISDTQALMFKTSSAARGLKKAQLEKFKDKNFKEYFFTLMTIHNFSV